MCSAWRFYYSQLIRRPPNLSFPPPQFLIPDSPRRCYSPAVFYYCKMMQLAEPTADSATDTSRPPRHYLPENFVVTDWATIEPFFQELQARPVQTATELERWLLDRSELEFRAWAFWFCRIPSVRARHYGHRARR